MGEEVEEIVKRFAAGQERSDLPGVGEQDTRVEACDVSSAAALACSLPPAQNYNALDLLRKLLLFDPTK
eukprot:244939-Hanusia_phi.AAC.2